MKMIKYFLVILSVGLTLYCCNELFILDWRIEYSKARVAKSIKRNFIQNKESFIQLKDYLAEIDLKPASEIELSKHQTNYDKSLLDYENHLGISTIELDSLRSIIENLNCEAIYVHLDKSISLVYEGHTLYRYEYYLPLEKWKPKGNYEKLAEGIYAGLYDSGLFCNYYIFKK